MTDWTHASDAQVANSPADKASVTEYMRRAYRTTWDAVGGFLASPTGRRYLDAAATLNENDRAMVGSVVTAADIGSRIARHFELLPDMHFDPRDTTPVEPF